MLTAIACFVFACLVLVVSVKIYARFRDNITRAYLTNDLKRQPTESEIAEAEQEAETAMAQVPGLFPYHGGGNIL